MKIVTKQEFFDWIMSQNDDRSVDMQVNWTDEDSCGCLMVQYGREKFPEYAEFGCGYKEWEDNNDVNEWGTPKIFAKFQDFTVSNLPFKSTTFGEFKQYIIGLSENNN